MAIDLTLAHATTSATTAANCAINRPAGTVDGDLILAVLYIEDDIAVTPPSGWTQVATVDHPSQPYDGTVWWKRASGEPTSWTWSHASAWRQGEAWRVAGVLAAGDPIDGTATTNSGTGTTGTWTGLTTSQANSAVIGIGFHWDAGRSWSGTSLSERLDTTQLVIQADIQAAAGATGNKTGTLSSSSDWATILLALREATAGAVVVDLAGAPGQVVAVVADPVVVLGSLGLDGGAGQVVAVVVDPAVVLGSLALEAGPVSVVAAVGAPTLLLSSLTVDLSGAPGQMVALASDPTVAIGSVGAAVAGTVTLVESAPFMVGLTEGANQTASLTEEARHEVTLVEALV